MTRAINTNNNTNSGGRNNNNSSRHQLWWQKQQQHAAQKSRPFEAPGLTDELPDQRLRRVDCVEAWFYTAGRMETANTDGSSPLIDDGHVFGVMGCRRKKKIAAAAAASPCLSCATTMFKE
ncbi:unnamed protein product [Fusarium graminearum]|uniref:Chromosome 3, complete genome n=2 Tax=Gibberella zeae TaxID=5518 RepID=A0A098E1P3_GIBZE|nr:unnamed protein product [Fusarium graminearum]CAG1991127.1 unnamed protein product [Fusarium graminearum]CAG2006385.1 unnamed protein product [Fusarium graminearum]CEF88030.1 unnamed protein product [Fusarium graminearum]